MPRSEAQPESEDEEPLFLPLEQRFVAGEFEHGRA
jgi:hypothetical protein